MIAVWGGPFFVLLLAYAVLWQLTAPLRRRREERKMAERTLRVRRWEAVIEAEEAHREMVHAQDRLLREQRQKDREDREARETQGLALPARRRI